MGKSVFVSASGFMSAFWTTFIKACYERGVDDEGVYNALKEDGPMIGQFADIVAALRRTKKVMFRIVRDGKLVEEKVKEGFVYVDTNITSQNFTAVAVVGPNPDEAILVNFGEDLDSSEEALARIDKMGLRLGLPTELADVSKSLPSSSELAACFPLVALGDSWVAPDGHRYVTYLHGGAVERELSLSWWSHRWTRRYWFLAFRKYPTK